MLLYDSNGAQKGFMKFKFKKVGVCVVQTEDVLDDPQLEEKENES